MCQACTTLPGLSGVLVKASVRIRKALSVSGAGEFKKAAWDRVAADLSNLLLTVYDKQRKEAINEVIRAINGSKPFTEAELTEMMNILRSFLSDAFTAEISKPLSQVQAAALEAGAMQVISVLPVFNLVNPDTLDWLDKHQIFWVKNYFDRRLAGEVSKAAAQVIRDGMSRDDAANFFLQQFKDKFDVASYRYWDGFANHVVTQARSMGQLEGLKRAGAKFYRVVAIMDHRTSDICRVMHNRIIPVSAGEALKQVLEKAENPEDIKTSAPFLKPDEAAGKTTAQLLKLSPRSALPPYHFDCRSTVVVHKPSALKLKESGQGKNTSDVLDGFAGGLSEEETKLWLQDFRHSAKSMRYEPADLKSDLIKHGAEWDVKDGKALTGIAKRLVRQSKHVAFQDFDGQLQAMFFTSEGYAVADLSGVIRGVYKHTDGIKAFEFRAKPNTYWYILE